MAIKKTIVGDIDSMVLSFTVGDDPVLDAVLAEVDCIGSAAHVTMLSKIDVKPKVITVKEKKDLIAELCRIRGLAKNGKFKITVQDQDVHMAVERALTNKLGAAGKKIHMARSRNDQVALDLRLYGKESLLKIMEDMMSLADGLFKFARKHVLFPMVGRTHMQKAMPSSVGLWASACGESLLDDMEFLMSAYKLNNKCPLGSAAGYGVPVDIDRDLTARLLGFSGPIHNVLYAANARGKCESIILSSLSQVMLTLSRFAEDLILYSAPEFGYFDIPDAYCTGSSIMPQKKNPDVLELVRAKAKKVMGQASIVADIVTALPSGYNRDLQETKGPFMLGIETTSACVQILSALVGRLKVDKKALLAGFSPDVFAADEAIRLVSGGMTFRDAYDKVKGDLDNLSTPDPIAAIKSKIHLGSTAGLDFPAYTKRVSALKKFVSKERRLYSAAVTKLMTTS